MSEYTSKDNSTSGSDSSDHSFDDDTVAVEEPMLAEEEQVGQDDSEAHRAEWKERIANMSDDYQFMEEFGNVFERAFAEKASLGSFAATGSLDNAPAPGLHIEGAGDFGSPLTTADAERIISCSSLAPFGKKDKTIVDTTVRDTWQIDASKVKLRNPAWKDLMKRTVLPRVATELGVSLEIIKAHLYKLLLYGEGGHFDKHQDTEKEPGMFGTLVIVLPSRFEGGQVTVSHAGQELTFDTAPNSEFGTSFTCLYTDVYHKVHPVTSGYRVALAYNLVVRSSGPLPRAPEATAPIIALRDMLEAWLDRHSRLVECRKLIVHVLEHQYSDFGFSNANLKGSDASKLVVLRNLADALGLKIYLACLDITVVGHNGDDYGRSMSMDEIGDTTFKLVDNGFTIDGKLVPLRHLQVDSRDIVPDFDSEEYSYDDMDTGGYTGNEGTDITHYYHRAAVLLWPASSDLTMLIRGRGSKAVANEISAKIRKYSKSSPPAGKDRDEIELYAKALPLDGSCVPVIAEAAVLLKNVDILKRIARSPRTGTAVAATTWIEAIRAFGSLAVCSVLDVVLKSSLKATKSYTRTYDRDRMVKNYCKVLLQLYDASTDNKTGRDWVNRWCEKLLSAVESIDSDFIGILAALAGRTDIQNTKNIVAGFILKLTKESTSSYSYRYGRKPSDLVFDLYSQMRQACPEASAWFDQEEIKYMSLIPDAEMSKDIVDRAKVIAVRTGYDASREMLSATINKAYSNSWIMAPILDLLVDLRESVTWHSDAAASAWVDAALKRHMSNITKLSEAELQSLLRLVALSIETEPAVVSGLLSWLERERYSTEYLLDTVGPFVAALAADERLPSFDVQPFLDFAKKFARIAVRTFKSSTPPTSFNFSLPPVHQDDVDGFLQSSAAHTLRVSYASKCRSVKKALDPLVRQGRVVCNMQGTSPQQLLIRKCKGIPRSASGPGDLNDKLYHEYKAAVQSCYVRANCESCTAIDQFLAWMERQAAGADLLEIFGDNWPTLLPADKKCETDIFFAARKACGVSRLRLFVRKGPKPQVAGGKLTTKPANPGPRTSTSAPHLVHAEPAGKRKATDIIDLTDSPEPKSKSLKR